MGLDLGMAAIRHSGWWLRWQTDRHACREAAVLAAPPADAAERAA